MTTGIPENPPIPAASRALKSAEWMAENAYIAPGFHRLLTAGGLSLGLWGGRHLMDVITARDASTGEETNLAHTPEIVRPLHGIMRYNPYSDSASDRWKFVIDRMAPVALGAVTAYWGGKLFFHGKIPGREPFSPVSASVKKLWEEKKISTDITDTMLGITHSDATRKWAAATFVEGSAAGMHLPGALWPFNNGMIAVSFQQGARRSINFPGLPKLNRWLGNYGATSRYLQIAMRDTAKWVESNVVKFGESTNWVTDADLLRRAQDGLQKFPNRTPADEQKLVGALRTFIDDTAAFHQRHMRDYPQKGATEVREAVYKFVSGAHDPKRGLTGAAYDHFLHALGFNLSEIKLARDPWAFFSRLFGSRQHEQKIMQEYAQYLNKEFDYKLNPVQWAHEQVQMEPWKVAAAYGGGLAAIAAGLAGAGVVGARLHKESSHTHKPHIHLPGQPDKTDSAPQKPEESRNLVEWINSKPLDVAHWISRVVITPPSMHRFMNAAYLSAVLYGGMHLTNVLTGRRLSKLNSGLLKNGIPESILPIERVWAPFKPLHGILAYTPGSVAIQDRWRQAAHYILPVAAGAFGTYSGSYFYFRDRIKSLEQPKTLEDYADRISMEQSQIYAGATAITSIFNTGSGMHLLPIFNYSSNLHNRYLMGSGQQVALPGIGKWWSGNAGTTPWGVKRSLQFMSNYLTFNTVARPRELPTLVHSVIGKLYPNLSESELLDKKQIIIDRIYDVRDSFLVEGVVPPSKRDALDKAMNKLLSGEGFEALLREAELDPAKANLANNGACGTIANFFGKRKTVNKLTDEYRQQFAERSASEKLKKPSDFIRELVDKGTAANDSSFASRVSSEEKPVRIIAA